MQFISCRNSNIQRVVKYWVAFGFLLILLIMIKEMVIRVHFHTEEASLFLVNEVTTNSPYRIYINLDEQRMYVFKNESLLKSYPVSGGKINSPSPVGDWIIVQKGTWGNGFGGSWMGLNVPWGNYGIHGTRTPWAIGRENVSGGCIRMNNEDANELYKLVSHGTQVKIVFDNQPFRNLKNGDFGSDVYQAQKALKQLGYFHDWCNGKYGISTEKAVFAYQKNVNLSQTGIVNISTWEKLMEQYREILLE